IPSIVLDSSNTGSLATSTIVTVLPAPGTKFWSQLEPLSQTVSVEPSQVKVLPSLVNVHPVLLPELVDVAAVMVSPELTQSLTSTYATDSVALVLINA